MVAKVSRSALGPPAVDNQHQRRTAAPGPGINSGPAWQVGTEFPPAPEWRVQRHQHKFHHRSFSKSSVKQAGRRERMETRDCGSGGSEQTNATDDRQTGGNQVAMWMDGYACDYIPTGAPHEAPEEKGPRARSRALRALLVAQFSSPACILIRE